MNYLFYIFIFFFGSAIGSFLNVVICRLKTGEEIVKKRSHCVQCGQVLRWYDLIPILSFFILRGRCRDCRKKISWQYPIVEIATGLLLVAVYQFISLSVGQFGDLGFGIFNLFRISDLGFRIFYFCYLLYVICSLIVIFVYDLRHYIIPDKMLFPAIAATLLFRILNLGFISNFESLLNPLVSALGAAAFFLFLVLITRGRGMGIGDIKLVFLLGLILGWPKILLALFLAFLAGAGIGLILIAAGKRTMKSQIPFGPFLIAGALITLFWGQEIINQYLGLFM